jgi:hypothetical protein
VFADFELRLARGDASVGAVLRHPLGIEALQRHAATEFSAENVGFWAAVDAFRELPPGAEAEASIEAARATRTAPHPSRPADRGAAHRLRVRVIGRAAAG